MTAAARQAIRRAERFADGEGTLAGLGLAHRAVTQFVASPGQLLAAVVFGIAEVSAATAARLAAWIAMTATAEEITTTELEFCSHRVSKIREEGRATASARHCGILCDLFGPTLFRDARADPAWLAWNGGTVRTLAAGIYAEGAFDRMPILADALEEAGCDNAAILAHCRGQDRVAGVHVRGCWVVDSLTGR
jgi:hypothetical protein